MNRGYDPVSEYHLWVIRHRETHEPIMLVKSEYRVPSAHVLNRVRVALYPQRELISNIQTHVFSKDGFTGSEWNTWLAFGVCPAIEIYTYKFRQPLVDFGDTQWEWRRIET